MPYILQRNLAQRSRLYRYLYYLISSFRLTSFSTWKTKGEPNPFVTKKYRPKASELADFADIFDDYKSRNT